MKFSKQLSSNSGDLPTVRHMEFKTIGVWRLIPRLTIFSKILMMLGMSSWIASESAHETCCGVLISSSIASRIRSRPSCPKLWAMDTASYSIIKGRATISAPCSPRGLELEAESGTVVSLISRARVWFPEESATTTSEEFGRPRV